MRFLFWMAAALSLAACSKKHQAYRPIQSMPLPAERAAVDEGKPRLVVPSGHAAAITYVAFTPDLERVVTAGLDGLVKVWDIETGRELFSRGIEHLGPVALLGGGRRLAAKTTMGVLVLDLEGLRPVAMVEVSSTICSLAAAPDGQLIAGTAENDLKLIDPLGGRELRSLGGFGSCPKRIEVSADGRLVAGRSVEAETRVFELATGRLVASFEGPEPYGTAFALTPDGRGVVSVGVADYRPGMKYGRESRSLLRVWDLESGKVSRTVGQQPRPSRVVAVSPDGARYVTGGVDGLLRVYDSTSGALLKTLTGHREDVQAVAFSADGKRLLSGGDDQTARLWNLESGRETQRFTGQVSTVNAVAATADGRTLLIAGQDVHFWDVASGREVSSIASGQRTVHTLGLSPDGRLLATGGSYGLIKVWNLPSGREVNAFRGREGNVTLVGFTPYGHLVSATSLYQRAQDGGPPDGISVWSLETGKLVRSFAERAGGVEQAALSPDGKMVALPGEDGTVAIYSTVSGAKVRDLPAPADKRAFGGSGLHSFTFSADGRRLAWIDSFSVVLVTLAEGTPRRIGDTFANANLQFTADGNGLVSVGREGKLQTFVAPFEAPAAEVALPVSNLGAMTLLPDGKRALVGGGSGAASVVDLATGEELASLWSLSSGWVTTSPTGHFDGSPEALKQMSWTRGAQSYPLDAFSEGYFSPGLLPRRLAGEPVAAAAQGKLSEGFSPPPEVRIASPADGAEVDAEVVEVVVQATDRGGGIDEIRLYQEGKAVGGGERGVKTSGSQRSFQVALAAGQNKLRAVALSRERIEGAAAGLTVIRRGGTRRPALHLVIAGINRYKNPALDLNFALPDARAVASFFKGASPLFEAIDSKELLDRDATKPALLEALQGLRATPPEDVVIIYLAGHGESVGPAWYFLPWELTYPEREGELAAKALSSAELREQIGAIGARKVLLMMDACKSGSALIAFRGFEERKALAQLARATGVHVMAAAGQDQFAAEVKDLGHGAFTYTLLQGLRGAADGSPKDGTVTVRELLSYVESQLPEISQKYRTEAQYPVVDSRGMDFPLATAK